MTCYCCCDQHARFGACVLAQKQRQQLARQLMQPCPALCCCCCCCCQPYNWWTSAHQLASDWWLALLVQLLHCALCAALVAAAATQYLRPLLLQKHQLRSPCLPLQCQQQLLAAHVKAASDLRLLLPQLLLV
jgi:hypothetical protein